jgi:glucokinase
MKEPFNLLGVDIGGTKIAISLGTSDGRLLGSKRVSNKLRPPEDVIPELFAAGHELLKESGLTKADIKAIGIGAPAPADIPNGIITSPTNNKSWKNVPIRDMLAVEFDTEAFFDNDANAGALAEWIFGSAQGCENMIYLTMSTGIGGGIITNGRLVRGSSYFAGEIGHISLDPNGRLCNCGMHGCYEAFCGGMAIAQRVQEELKDQPDHPIVRYAGGDIKHIDMIAIEKAVRDGDDYAVKLWDEMCMRNAQGIGLVINIFNPDKVVLGTLAWATGDLFMKPLLEQLPHFCWKEMYECCEVVPSALKRNIGEYAGIAVALNYLHEDGRFKLPWQK